MTTWLRRLAAGLRALVTRRREDAELDDELRAYLDAVVAEKVRGGLTPAEALRAAKREVGSLEAIKEHTRAVGWETRVEAVVQDVRYAARRLMASPGFTITAVATLALGIGANAAIFSLFNGLMLRSIAIPGADRLVAIGHTYHGQISTVPQLKEEESRAVAIRDAGPFDRVFTSDASSNGLSANDRAGVVFTERISGDYFSTLGVVPRAGRLLAPGDDAFAATTAIVISEAVWRPWFNEDPAAIGAAAKVAGVSATIVGVVPDTFKGTWMPTFLTTDVWIPIAATDRAVAPANMAGRPYQRRTFARLRPGVSFAQAVDAVRAAGRAFQALDPANGLDLLPAWRGMLFDEVTSAGRQMGAAVVGLSGLVFLIACANLTNLVLARTTSRTAEIAIRLATGASRLRVFRLLLIEAVLLSAAAAAASIVVTLAATALMAHVALPVLDGVSFHFDPSPDWHVFAYGLAAAMVGALVVGVLPARRGARTEPLQVLAASGEAGRRGRQSLVAVQAGCTVVLLLSGGLYARSALKAATFDPGYDTDHSAIATVDFNLLNIRDARRQDLARRMLAAARAIPGVTRAVLAEGWRPYQNDQAGDVAAEGTPPPTDQTGRFVIGRFAAVAGVSPGFFGLLRIPIDAGRDFTEADDAGSPPVAIVSETLARRLWPGEQALGRRLRTDPKGPFAEVVGVARDIAPGLVVSISGAAIYLPAEQHYSPRASVLVTGPVDPRSLVTPLRRAIESVDADLAVSDAVTMPESVGLIFTPIRLAAVVLGALSLLGLGLAVLGVYGTTTYFVSQRTREFGIRKALGATSTAIYAIVARQTLRPLLAGVVPGLIAAFGAAGLLTHLIYGVAPRDTVTFTVVPITLVVVGLAAALLAARRAARVDPNTALRTL